MYRSIVVFLLLGPGVAASSLSSAAQPAPESKTSVGPRGGATPSLTPEQAEDSNVIRLRARAFVPAPGLGAGLEGYLVEHARERTVHVLVQFSAIPSLEERAALTSKMNVHLLDPVPERAFVVAMSPDLDVAHRLLDTDIARWVGIIGPEDKMEPTLLVRGVPEWARQPLEAAELIVQFFGDVPVRHQEVTLRAHGARVLARVEELNGWRIVLPEHDIPRLAGVDAVKWLAPVPPPAELDNDGVRSATGVGADAVQPPAAYNLTGSGTVIGHWETTHASLLHPDYASRIVVGDPPLTAYDRSVCHTETVAANGQFDDGELIYRDVDDSRTVSAGDVRVTKKGQYAAGTEVQLGEKDAVKAFKLVFFKSEETFADTIKQDWLYTKGEGIYRDNDKSQYVSAGDTRLTAVGMYAAGSIVKATGATKDLDVGQQLCYFLTNPHYHSTHVAGTAIGNGAQSAAQGGASLQWKGVAPGASIRSYDTPVLNTEYANAAANKVAISTNSWGIGHYHQIFPPAMGYEAISECYDSVISGRRSDGTASGLARRMLIVASAGNQGRPERHTENIAKNGQYDNGEAIYYDWDDSGTVSAYDQLLLGPAQKQGDKLVNFAPNERHADPYTWGGYYPGDGIYLDADNSRTVTVGDTRIIATAGYSANSKVAANDTDEKEKTNLRQFKLWGNVRIPNSAKNTIEVANITSDSNTLFPSSSRGPTDDGRLKPDLAGPGSQAGGDGGVTSTYPGPGGLYKVYSGTSMSTPAVAGCAALLTEWYGIACKAAGPDPHSLRALLIHGAEDLSTVPNVGSFPGPDFSFGWGRARIKQACDLLPHHLVGTATATGDTDYKITVGAMQPLRVTLAWDDPAWSSIAAPSPATGLLYNDLDLLLIAPDKTHHTPWLANGENPFAPAGRSAISASTPIPSTARDRRNTVEQVVVDNAMAGTWTIRVTASTLKWPPQSYTLVGEVIPPQQSPCTATPTADVWMRDNGNDKGKVPSSGTMYLSPDIWNRLVADGTVAHENPEFGQKNYLYAYIRNASAVAVKVTSIEIWLAPAATGLSWPSSFTRVGEITVPHLKAQEIRKVGPLAWFPPEPKPSDHFCLYVRVMSPQDPITFAETPKLWTNAANSNNIVWRNINVVDLKSSQTVCFLVRNVEDEKADVDLVCEIPEEFLDRGRAFLQLSPELERRWPEEYRSAEGVESLADLYRETEYDRAPPHLPYEVGRHDLAEVEEAPTPIYELTTPSVRLRGFRLEPKQAEPVRLTFTSGQKIRASYEIDVIERIRGEIIGGIRYIVRTGYGEHD